MTISFYDALQVLIEHGHDKYKVLHEYSKEEVALFYEKCMKHNQRNSADFIESVAMGIGIAFGGVDKRSEKILKQMKE